MVARRLARSPRELAADFPLSPATVRALPPEVEDDLDAFLVRARDPDAGDGLARRHRTSA